MPTPLTTFKRKPFMLLYVAGVALLLAGALVWYFKVSINPERVFWDALGQSLSTRSVTIQADQSSNGASVHQSMQYSLGATNITHSITKVVQGNTTIVNELVGTPTTDYTRYVSVHTDQKGAGGKALDFSHILGVWAKGNSGSAQLFSQGVLGVGLPIGGVAIPVGNVPAAKRDKLIHEIKSDVVYHADFTKVTSKRDHGRLEYVYNVNLEPVAYANLMQQFAKAMGLHDLDALDPGAFKGQQAIKMRLTIDVRSHHLVAAEIPSTGASQTYTSYDIPSTFTIPKSTISVDELQKRLTNL